MDVTGGRNDDDDDDDVTVSEILVFPVDPDVAGNINWEWDPGVVPIG